MLCQNCGKREATTHIKRVVNGETSESHLCAECAASLGYADVFSGFGLSFGDLLGGFLGGRAAGTARRQPLPEMRQLLERHRARRKSRLCGLLPDVL